MTRRLILSAALLTGSLALTGCTAPAAEPTATPTLAPDSAPSAPLMEVPADDANWECGHVSALQGILFRSEWELENGVINQAAFDSRAAALVDAWTSLPTGRSDVTPALREAIAAAASGVTTVNEDFALAMVSLIAACDAAGSVVIVGALPEMGG